MDEKLTQKQTNKKNIFPTSRNMNEGAGSWARVRFAGWMLGGLVSRPKTYRCIVRKIVNLHGRTFSTLNQQFSFRIFKIRFWENKYLFKNNNYPELVHKRKIYIVYASDNLSPNWQFFYPQPLFRQNLFLNNNSENKIISYDYLLVHPGRSK